METETPLLDLLASVPEDGRAIVETEINTYQSIPYGKLCRAARDEIVRLRKALYGDILKLREDQGSIIPYSQVDLSSDWASDSTVSVGWAARMPVIEALAKDILKLHRPDAEGAD